MLDDFNRGLIYLDVLRLGSYRPLDYLGLSFLVGHSTSSRYLDPVILQSLESYLNPLKIRNKDVRISIAGTFPTVHF